MAHRFFTGFVLAVLVWWAVRALEFSHGTAPMLAAIPLLSALLNLLTGPVFTASALALLATVAFDTLVDDEAKARVTAGFHGERRG